MQIIDKDVTVTGIADDHYSLPVVIQAENRRMDIVQWVLQNRTQIEEWLLQYGGVLFRKFRINGTAHFERFIQEAFQSSLLSYDNRSTPRTSVKGHIYTSTEYPHDQSIPLHNENAYTRAWARKIFFYCIKPSEQGGQTPIADSRRIFNKIPDAIKTRFDRHGLLYVRNYSGLDLPWQDVFQTEDKSKVEAFCQENDIEYEWVNSDHLRTRQLCQAIIQHPQTKAWVWFNQAHLFHISNLADDIRSALTENFSKEDLPRNVYFGDGSNIANEDLEIIRRIYEEEAVIFPWLTGDIMLLDNMLAAHGRCPYEGQRKVVVGMIESYRNSSVKALLAE